MDLKDYKEIEIGYKETIKDAVELMQESKAKGVKAYCNFNGHILTSDDTLDEAYLKAMGRTYSQFKEGLESMQRNAAKTYDEYMKSLPALKEKYLKKAKTTISTELFEDFKDDLNVINTPVCNASVRNFFDIAELIQEGKDNFEKALKITKEYQHSGCSLGVLKILSAKYLRNGKDFVGVLIAHEL